MTNKDELCQENLNAIGIFGKFSYTEQTNIPVSRIFDKTFSNSSHIVCCLKMKILNIIHNHRTNSNFRRFTGVVDPGL